MRHIVLSCEINSSVTILFLNIIANHIGESDHFVVKSQSKNIDNGQGLQKITLSLQQTDMQSVYNCYVEDGQAQHNTTS